MVDRGSRGAAHQGKIIDERQARPLAHAVRGQHQPERIGVGQQNRSVARETGVVRGAVAHIRCDADGRRGSIAGGRERGGDFQ